MTTRPKPKPRNKILLFFLGNTYRQNKSCLSHTVIQPDGTVKKANQQQTPNRRRKGINPRQAGMAVGYKIGCFVSTHGGGDDLTRLSGSGKGAIFHLGDLNHKQEEKRGKVYKFRRIM